MLVLWGTVRVVLQRAVVRFGRKMALPKAKEIVASNPVVVFRSFYFFLSLCLYMKSFSSNLRVIEIWMLISWWQQVVLSVLRDREAAFDSIGHHFQGHWVGHWKWDQIALSLYIYSFDSNGLRRLISWRKHYRFIKALELKFMIWLFCMNLRNWNMI